MTPVPVSYAHDEQRWWPLRTRFWVKNIVLHNHNDEATAHGLTQYNEKMEINGNEMGWLERAVNSPVAILYTKVI